MIGISIWNYFIEEELIITHLNWNFLVETVHSFASRSCLWFTNTDSTHQDGKFCWSGDLEKKIVKIYSKNRTKSYSKPGIAGISILT